MCNDSTFEKLLALLRRVTEHSEFYRQKYRREGFDIREIRTPEDIAKIPLTTKNELRDNGPADYHALHKKGRGGLGYPI